MNLVTKNFIKFCSSLFLCILLLISCSGSGSTGSSNTGPGGTGSTQVGILPNGTTVISSNNNIPFTSGSNTKLTFSLESAQPGTYSISFNGNPTPTTKSFSLKSLFTPKDSTVVSVTPNPCQIQVTNTSGGSNSCVVTVSIESGAAAGIYAITPTATAPDGTVTALAPVTALVSTTSTTSTNDLITLLLKDSNNNVYSGIINGLNIAFTIPNTVNLSSLAATYIIDGAYVTVNGESQVNGVTTNNFYSNVVYVVHAQNGTTQDYTVTVTPVQNAESANSITAFAINGTQGVINGNNINLTLAPGTNVNPLIATFVTTGTSVKVGSMTQISSITPNNFESPVTYTVTAANGNTQNYVATVNVPTPSPSPSPTPTPTLSPTPTPTLSPTPTPTLLPNFIALGNDNSGNVVAYASSNGTTWESTVLESSLSNTEFTGITYGESQFVAAGNDMNGLVVIITSSDGVHWTKSNLPSPLNSASAIVYGSGTFIASTESNGFLISIDGITWIESYIQASINGITYGNGTFVAVGISGTIAISNDNGNSWSISNQPPYASFNGVTYGNATFVAVGNNNAIIYSSNNGISWNNAASPESAGLNNFTGAVYGADKFVVVSDTGLIATSTDGNTWVPAESSPTSNNLIGVTYSNANFAVISSNSIYSSSDGNNWTPTLQVAGTITTITGRN